MLLLMYKLNTFYADLHKTSDVELSLQTKFKKRPFKLRYAFPKRTTYLHAGS